MGGPALRVEQAQGRALRIGQTWEVSTWEIAHLESCHLAKYPWEVTAWEKTSEKIRICKIKIIVYVLSKGTFNQYQQS